MKPEFISSSNIDAVAYSLGNLFIRFHSGGVYSYDKVPFAIYDGIRTAESAGKFFHRFIKGQYEYHKLDSDPFAQ